MSNTWCPSSTNTSNRSPNCGDSAAAFVSHGGSDERHLVDIGCVVEGFNGFTERLGLTDGVEDIDTGVAVGQAAVVVGGDVERVGVADFEQFSFSIVLIVHHKMAFNHLFIRHLCEVASSLHIGKGHSGVPKESASVVVAGILHQLLQPTGELLVNAERDDFAHG